MRFPSRTLVVALVALVLGAVQVPLASAAAVSTKGFWVRNYASHGFELTAVQSLPSGHPPVVRPNHQLLPIGYRFEPGMEAHFELDYEYSNYVSTTWTVLDEKGYRTNDSFDLKFGVDGDGVRQSEITRAATDLDVRPNFQDIWILDPPGTRTELTAGPNGGTISEQEAAALAGRLCAWDEFSCQFTLQGQSQVVQDTVIVDGPFLNNTCSELSLSLSEGDTKVLATGWDITVTMDAKLAGLVDTSVRASGGRTNTSTATFKATTEAKTQPGHAGWWQAAVTVTRSTGTFHVVGANTEWFLHMTVDSPQDGGVTTWDASPQERAQTPTELSLLPHACA